MTSRRIFRDPFSGFSHLLGAVLGVLGLFYLVAASRAQDARTVAAVVVYGISMVLLYAASSTYHLLNVRPELRIRLRQLDHAMVPVFIAGSYTPFCLIALQGSVGDTVLATVWALGGIGLLKSIFWVHAPRWVTAGTFVAMGWVIVFAAQPLSQAVSGAVIGYILAGGIAYTLGALIYAKKWPDPWPPAFGFHEIWHLCVLTGSALHYAGVLALLPR